MRLQRAATPSREPRQRPLGGTLSTTMPDQPLDTRFPGQVSPWEASSRSSTATSSPPSPSCGTAKPSSPSAKPTSGAYATLGSRSSRSPDRRSDHASGRGLRRALLERHLNMAALTTRWLFRFDTATARAGICRHDTRTIALLVCYVLRAPWDDMRHTLLPEIAHVIVGPSHAHERPVADGRAALGVHRKAPRHRRQQPEWSIGEVPRCRDRWFRQRLTARRSANARSARAVVRRSPEESTPTEKAVDHRNTRAHFAKPARTIR